MTQEEKDAAIEYIDLRIDQLYEISTVDEYHSLRKLLITGLNRIFGDKTHSKMIKEIKVGSLFLLDSVIRNTKNVLIGFKQEIVLLNVAPKKGNQSNTFINKTTNTTNNNTTINIEFVINHLSHNQQIEIKNIIKENSSPEVKNEKIIDKLKSFGVDVLSNIVAGIISSSIMK